MNADEMVGLSATEQVTVRLREWILSGELAAGRRLPSERALARQLNVTRGAVRVAFDALE